MSLLQPDEITVEALMADLPMQRSARHQLELQTLSLLEGLTLAVNPLLQSAPNPQYVVKDGDSLQIVSLRLFGVIDYWRAIAELNRIDYPFVVYPGRVLQVPIIGNDG
ncbi:LysM peptidoglycan-binding domain-containing protein [Leptolyngbya sp. FACHB-36]|uniref:LysM peptidoglycan-binding domain-containing protein n=1 Tax=Leptolyngbya sp. FACHB-36 TaxID=2692808 RepID=UPI0016800FD3|nr:LysM domain-containing protein [Leptolyngbya sp. FACHB-36]MBD2019358.1 LysM peptidoglycan-binding domain-containing protein [Leptolyngbya sp. FACHB-36]